MNSMGGVTGRPSVPDQDQIVETQDAQETALFKQEADVAKADTLKEIFTGPDEENPFVKTTKDKEVRNEKEVAKLEDKAKGETKIQKVEHKADSYSGDNPGLKKDVLIQLRNSLRKNDNKETILNKVLNQLGPAAKMPHLVQAALKFLLETTDDDPALQKEVQAALDSFTQAHKQSIASGRNISPVVVAADKAGIGAPADLTQLYSKVVHDPVDTPTLFEQLSKKYPYRELVKVLKFLEHAIGADLNSKGPSIEPAELIRLRTEVVSLQAVKGVYRFFQARMPLVESMFKRSGGVGV